MTLAHKTAWAHADGIPGADRQQQGALLIEQVLKIGVEIADALDKAHLPRNHASRPEARQYHADEVWSQTDGLRSG